ncbi:cysteine--tRNA ligase [uncultured Thermanaerothrix sp.]|uniref:cysteine--tRNA ligase n=1 Tax=uncultured Thermanaerothrix sp. TaxID=1195149 RepID=UPI00262845F0|nr:cysteine--tRNA ligase [uncultured Thermanaerothrix sp.]
MALRIYNTLTRKKEDFETLEPGNVRMYVCGPTVYDKAHIGHAMSALVFDIIRRYLEYRGYAVKFVMNYTDVDDKIIRRAQELGEDPFRLAERYIEDYRRNLEALNVKPATVNPRATQEIEPIIAMIQGLIEKGHAYVVDGDVYFRVTSDPDYGKLSGRRLEEMQAGARIEVDERKEHPMDFALWKAAKPGEPAWPSPWGMGRPGWHIECSAMNLHHLGEQIDIHGGGNDLIFPHHENEIAQSESLTGKPFVRYWVHNGMVQLGGEKMSKSLGNLITIEEFLAKHPADVLRMMVLNSNYRSPLVYTDEVVQQSERALERLRSALRPALPGASGAPAATLEALQAQIEATRQGFIEAMDDDFNTAGALAALFELVRAINQARSEGATDEQLAPAQAALRELTGVLGLTLAEPPAAPSAAEPFIDLLVEVRNELRKQKLWALSDRIRDRLAELGVILEDAREGTTWRWKSS